MRIRLRFSKLGKIRFTSQRDVARMWERALRRAALPVAYSSGFSPRPQLSFGLALPTGCESWAEYLDVVLDDRRPESADVDVASLPGRMTALLPEGIEVEAAAPVEGGAGSLQQQVTSCSWVMDINGVTREDLATRVASLLAASSVPIVRERKGRQEEDDLRPSVRSLAVVEGTEPESGAVRVVAELSTQPRGVRPVELLRGLTVVGGPSLPDPGREGQPPSGVVPHRPGDERAEGVPVLDRACRTQQWIERDGIRGEPLGPSGSTTGPGRAAHALGRAS